jgi:hypothetical protein
LWAIDALSYDLYENKSFETNQPFISVVLNKILLQNEPGLAASLKSASNWCYNFKGEPAFEKFSEIFLNILYRFNTNPPEETEEQFLQENLILIAYTLHYRGLHDPVINRQLELLQTSRFNSVRYKMAYKLKGESKIIV